MLSCSNCKYKIFPCDFFKKVDENIYFYVITNKHNDYILNEKIDEEIYKLLKELDIIEKFILTINNNINKNVCGMCIEKYRKYIRYININGNEEMLIIFPSDFKI